MSNNATLNDLQSAESKLLLQTYARNPLLLVSGEGVHLRDEHGTDYLDLLSGIGVCALGYNHPAITKALTGGVKRVRILPAESATVLPDLISSRIDDGTEVIAA